MQQPDMPEIDQAVVRLNRKGNVKRGTVTAHRFDGTYWHFTVEWSSDFRVEYPAKQWRVTVDPQTCLVCDSEIHMAHPVL